MEYKLYVNVKTTLMWKRFCYDLLCQEIRSHEGTIDLKPNHFSKLIYRYYVDIINFEEDRAEIFKELIWKIGAKTNLDDDVIDAAINEAYALTAVAKIEPPVIKIWKEGRNVRTSISGICTSVPAKVAIRLQAYGRDEFSNLCLRYNVLGPSDGLFLSIDKDVYQYLADTSTLPVIEGYASPFNNNLDQYCSVYPEDLMYGSLGTYKEFITKLDTPARLILNPPYTNRMIDECINLLLDYMAKYQGEFVMMLPLMNDYEPMTRLLEFPGTKYRLMEGSNYTIHDHSRDCPLIAPMNLILVANIRNQNQSTTYSSQNDSSYTQSSHNDSSQNDSSLSDASQECVDDIAQFLSVKAINLKNEQSQAKTSRPWRSSKPDQPLNAQI